MYTRVAFYERYLYERFILPRIFEIRKDRTIRETRRMSQGCFVYIECEVRNYKKTKENSEMTIMVDDESSRAVDLYLCVR